MELNKTILSLRTEKGYTQERLAEMLGVSTAAVSKWETGNAYPDIMLLPKIAEIFDVSVDYLLGYDMTSKNTVAGIIVQANELRRKLKSAEAEALIEHTLARYPNNMQLRFELARHRFVNARYKKKAERERLLAEAEKEFLYISEHDDYKARRDWSLNFLTTINMIRKDFTKASECNDRLLCSKGLYPRVTSAVIRMNQSHDEGALQEARNVLCGCILESSMILPWITSYYMDEGNYDAVIKENLRAVKVYTEFVDVGWLYETLSECYEVIALAYAYKKEYDSCLCNLEKACDNAALHDKQGYQITYNVYDTAYDIAIEEAVRSSCRSMLNTLASSEREIYAPIHDTEQYKTIIAKLQSANK